MWIHEAIAEWIRRPRSSSKILRYAFQLSSWCLQMWSNTVFRTDILLETAKKPYTLWGFDNQENFWLSFVRNRQIFVPYVFFPNFANISTFSVFTYQTFFGK